MPAPTIIRFATGSVELFILSLHVTTKFCSPSDPLHVRSLLYAPGVRGWAKMYSTIKGFWEFLHSGQEFFEFTPRIPPRNGP